MDETATYADSYCGTPASGWFADLLRSGYCGVATVLSVPADAWVAIAGTAGETATGVASEAGDAAEGVTGNLADAASPLNLAGLGAGIGLGGTLAVVMTGLAAAVLVDQLAFGGAGTASAVRRVTGR